MSFQPVFENITLNEKLGEFTETLKVECKTGVSTETVKKIIFLSATPYLLNSECTGGGVKFFGKINFFICYENEEGVVKKHECATEFQGLIKTEQSVENCKAGVRLVKEKTDCDLSGLYLTPSITLQAKATPKEKKEFSFVVGGEGFFCDKDDFSHLKSLGEKTVSYPLEEEFDLPYPVEEVLSQKVVATVSSCQCGVGVIIVDGEVNISQILLQSSDKRDIIKEVRTFPFRAEIDCEDAMPSFSAVASVNEKSLRTDVTTYEGENKSVVSVSVVISLSGEAFALEELSVIKDAFSIDNDIEMVRERALCKKNKEQHSISERLSGRVEFDSLPVGATYCFTTEERVDIISTKVENNGVLVSGSMGAIALFKDEEGKIFSRKMETPFETLIAFPIRECFDYEITSKIKGCEEKILSLSSGELSIDVCFNFVCTEKMEINLVKEVKCGAEKKSCDSAISVYIPLSGETLFPLAKRLNVNPSELILTNKDLQFPLSGEERIIIYRQK